MKIEIEIDREKKAITSIKGMDELNPIEVAIIMNQISLRALSMVSEVKNKEEKKIIEPKLKIIGGNHAS